MVYGAPLLGIAVLTQIIAAPLTYLTAYRSRDWGSALAVVSSAVPFAITLTFFRPIYGGGAVYEALPWIPTLGLNFDLLLDQLSYPFALLITLMGLLATIYSTKYMERERNYESYLALLLLFNAGMLGVVLASNLFLFYLFWELMLIPSYFLIAYWGTGKPRIIGFKYFVFTHAGALSLLLGIAWIYGMFGSLELLELAQLTRHAPLTREVLAISALIFVGAAVKMAVFPFHTWLPDAHAEAPTPISVLLSGVMIKTGAYAIARMLMGLFPSAVPLMLPALAALAAATMVWGGVMALVQTDVKRLLAYSSVSQMGYILFGLITLSSIGVAGGLFHVLNHGFAKGMLFMGSGVLIHELGERDLRRLGGLASKMPLTATAMLVGGLSIAGTPPLGGFASEWMIFGGGMESGLTLYTAIAIAATAITAAYYLRMVRAVFFLKPKLSPERVKDAPPAMAAPISALLFLVIVLGFLNYPLTTIISHAATAILS